MSSSTTVSIHRPNPTTRSARHFILALGLVAVFTAVSPAVGWEAQIDSSQSEDDVARALALDARGYIFAGGEIEELGTRWLVVKLAPGDGHELWRAMPSGPMPFPWNERLIDLAVDANGDALGGGQFQGDNQDYADFAVVKLRGSDGAELWRVVLDDTASGSNEYVNAVAVDANGDVVAAGVAESTNSEWLIVKVRGSDGTVLWTRRIDGSSNGYDRPHDVAVTASGDVVAVGGTTNTSTGPDLTAVKLSGADGSVVWRTDLDGSGGNASEYAERMAIDASGDVYAAGRMATSGFSRFTVVKLLGSDGSLAWRGSLCCGTDPGAALSVALTNDGGVIAGGESRRQDLQSPFTVVRFDAATGGQDWKVILPGSTGYGRANAVAVDDRGDVWAAGQIEVTSEGKTDAFLAKIHPCGIDEPCDELEFSFDAEVVEQKRSDGSSTSSDDFDEYYSLVMGDQHAPIVAGTLYSNHPTEGAEEPHPDFVVERYTESGRDYSGPNPFVPACDDGVDNDNDGGADVAGDSGCDSADDLFEEAGSPVVHMVGGRKMIAKDKYGNLKARKLTMQSNDASLPLPAPSGPSDPSLHGAVLEVVNPATGERSFANLPASGWSGRGEPVGSAGYVYRDSKRTWGPCGSVQLRPGMLKASCKGAAIALSLDEPSQGQLSGRLHLAGGDRICTQFGGSVLADVSTAGGTGVFHAQDAPPPSTCAAP